MGQPIFLFSVSTKLISADGIVQNGLLVGLKLFLALLVETVLDMERTPEVLMNDLLKSRGLDQQDHPPPSLMKLLWFSHTDSC